MKEKLLSIIVPIYNAEADLKRCLDALLAQTYQPLEIILIDDGSTDGSFAVCQAYAQSNAGVCCYHQPNGGVSSARNKGLSMARRWFSAAMRSSLKKAAHQGSIIRRRAV